jgi:hypothetical protein
MPEQTPKAEPAPVTARAAVAGRRYEPLLILAVLQLLLVLVVPSRGTQNRQALTPSGLAAGSQSANGESGGARADDQTGAADAFARGASAQAAAGTAAKAAAATRGVGAAGVSEDKSKCAPGGLYQTSIITHSPLCVGRWVGDNGGATAKGVSKDEITIIYVRTPVPAVFEPIFKAGGLAATKEEEQTSLEVWGKFFNTHFEFYGRKMKFILDVLPCQSTDPDPAGCERQYARMLNTKYQPFYVFRFGGSGIPEFYDELSRLGILSIGGQALMQDFYVQHRPYHWELFPDGDRVAVNESDYWCKKMVGKKASLAGDPLIQAKDRRIGIVVDASFGAFGEITKRAVAAISGGRCATTSATKPVTITVSGDPTQSSQEFTAVAQAFKQENVTTVICMCAALVPVTMTTAFDDQQYFPEHLISGTGAIDVDALAQLYSPTQWRNAFGPSFFTNPVPKAVGDPGKAWADAGGPGGAEGYCLVCGAIFLYMQPIANQIQWAGAHLTAATLEQATLSSPPTGGWERSGHDPTMAEWRFGPGDYTAWEDVRQVYWDPAATSDLNGKKGAYVGVEGGKRYAIASWPPGDPKR